MASSAMDMGPRDLHSGPTPKLPMISESRGLVSPQQTSRSPSIKEEVALWASDIRDNIMRGMQEGEVDDADILRLRHEVIALFIGALQQDTRRVWMLLREALLIITPYSDLLSDGHQLTHYLERLHHHLDVHKERLFDLQVTEALRQVFPQEMERIQNGGIQPKKNYARTIPSPSLKQPSVVPARTILPPTTSLLPLGKNMFKLQLLEEKDLKPKPMTFGDLRASMADVAMEMATREAIWTACLGTTAKAMNIELPEDPEEESPPTTRRTSKTSSRTSIGDDASNATPRTPREQEPVLTGREAVEYFSRCYHTGKIKFMHFNIAPGRYFRPYDLISVPKNKVNKEHYVFSTFGVLHVFPDQPSENMSLADWQKEAVLFKAISCIPFFKMFLIKKMFHKWRKNVMFTEYSRTKNKIEHNLLEGMPSFGAALLQVSQLCQEVMQLNILPLEEDKCYQLIEFENMVFYLNLQTEKVMERFFKYAKVIMDTTGEELQLQVEHCEEQVRNRAVFTKDSLHLQRIKREQRESNLNKALYELGRMPTFSRLVDHLLLSQLIQLMRSSLMSFVGDVMTPNNRKKRDALFRANLVFGHKDCLTMQPPKEKFLRVLNRMTDDLPGLCTTALAVVEQEHAHLQTSTPLVGPTPPPESSPPPTTAKYSSRRASQMSHQTTKYTGAGSTCTSAPEGSKPPTRPEQNIETSKAASSEEEQILNSPELWHTEMPTKNEDDLGQATPRLVIGSLQAGQNSTLTEEKKRSAPANYKSITKKNLEEKLKNDEAYQEASSSKMAMVHDAINEINEYSEKNSWLNDIYKFCKSWTDESTLQWRGAQAFTIEQKLNELRQWSDKVRNFDKVYTTDNGIFHIDCMGIHDSLLPRLGAILKELCTFIADESASLAKKFIEEMKSALQNLENKNTTIGGFAVYARHVSSCKKNTGHYQQRVEYIKSLFEVIRMGYRQLTSEEEKMDEHVWNVWEAFLFQMQLATDFVNTQTPLLSQDLADNYQEDGAEVLSADVSAEASINPHEFLKLEQRAHELYNETMAGKFLDPTQNPAEILEEMTMIRDEFYEVQRQMQQASKWKEAITGEAYDINYLKQMGLQMDIRQELWKYIEVSAHEINEWKRQFLRKLNVRKALNKITEWQAAAGQLKSHLPQADGVLQQWYKSLVQFKQHLPYLHKLASDVLKARHWKAIFVGLGEPYDPKHDFIIEELLAYDLHGNGHIINKIYHSALAEFTIDEDLSKLRKQWQDKAFKLAKHIPDSVYKEESRPISRTGARKGKQSNLASYRRQKSATTAPKAFEVGDDMYLVIDLEEIAYLLEDSRVTLQRMLSSPFLADHAEEAQQWSNNLHDMEEMVNLWESCQTKWLFLVKIFEEAEMYRKYHSLAEKFQEIHQKYNEFMTAVLADPLVSSILPKNRNEPGYRYYQGPKLRDLLLSLIEGEEEIIYELQDIFQQAREQFSRLCFLSDDELVQLLSISRNPTALIPFARKCFSGLTNLTFALPSESGGMGSDLDFALNVHKLEVKVLHGELDETVPLCLSLPPSLQSTKWLESLEHGMKSTINTTLEACVHARLEEGPTHPRQILEEVTEYEKKLDDSTSKRLVEEVRQTYAHWLLRFPSQCVLVAEAIMWNKAVYRALDRQDQDELRVQQKSLMSHIDQYSQVLRANCFVTEPSETRTRLNILLGNLINQAQHHRDVIEMLLANQVLSDSGYDWLKVLKYHMEIRTVLQAQQDPSEHDSQKSARPSGPGEKQTSVADEEDGESVPRALTTVSTGYQFGKCLISQLGTTFTYDCEYLGPTKNLVTTPLTERAWLNLSMSLHTFTSGVLTGPPGTGKSETIHDLARAFGRHLVTYNCGDGMMLPVINRILTGVIQTGCWVLFDDMHRLPYGLSAVLGQQLETIGHALRVLNASSDNQYDIRGQPRFDKVSQDELSAEDEWSEYSIDSTRVERKTKSGNRIRRNSLTTLHSLPAAKNVLEGIERQATVPHGFNETGLNTYFEDKWVTERERRHSIEKEVDIRETDLYKAQRQPPLFYEFVTQHRQPKPNFQDLVPNYKDFKPNYLGNILFNGNLIRANAGYGCFMTSTLSRHYSSPIPQNMRASYRPCAIVMPDIHIIVETTLFCNGYAQHKTWANKIVLFIKLLEAQLPRRPQYALGLKTILAIINVATPKLHENLQIEQKAEVRASRKGKEETGEKRDSKSRSSSRLDEISPEEQAILKGLSSVLVAKMENEADGAILKAVMRDVFPQSSRPRSAQLGYKKQLVEAVERQLRGDNLHVSQDLVDKILLLYSALSSKQGVILSGPAGSGKTTCYRILAKALTYLHFGKSDEIKEEELAPERSLTFMYSQKLKVLQNAEERESAKIQPKRWKKVTNMSSLLSKVMKNWTSVVEEEEPAAKEIKYPKVEVEVILPNVLSASELYGDYVDGKWKAGLLTSLLQQSHDQGEAANWYCRTFDSRPNKLQLEKPSMIQKWLVLDGALDSSWVDGMHTLVDSAKVLSLANGGHVKLHEATSMIFEMSDLSNASPSIITQCGLVNLDVETITWKALWEAWGHIAKQRWVINTASWQVLTSMANSVFPSTLQFLQKECRLSLLHGTSQDDHSGNQIAVGVHQVTSFLRILSALLDRHLQREDLEKFFAHELAAGMSTPPKTPKTPMSESGTRAKSAETSASSRLENLITNYMLTIRHLFAFAYIWGFGGGLHDMSQSKFDPFARQALKKAAQPVNLPDGGSVYDFCLDIKHGQIIRWADRTLERARGGSNYVVIPEVDRYNFLIDLVMSTHNPVLLTGDPGVGKTSLVEYMVQVKHPFSKVKVSPSLSSAVLQEFVSLRVNFTNELIKAPMPGKVGNAKPKTHHLFFLDDLNTTKAQGSTGVQPVSELLRQIISHEGVYDLKRHIFTQLTNVDFLAAATNLAAPGSGYGYGSQVLSSRLLRLFTIFNMSQFSDTVLHSIFGRPIQTWLEEFPNSTVEHHYEFAKALVHGALSIYKSVRQKLNPTPATPHYVFSMHDVAQVIQGLLLVSSRSNIKGTKATKKPVKKTKQPREKNPTVARDVGSPSDMPAGSRSQSTEPKRLGSITPSEVQQEAPPGMRVITRLWCHEVTRIFGDRILSKNDIHWFDGLVEDTVRQYFCSPSEESHEKMSTIMEDASSHGVAGAQEENVSQTLGTPQTGSIRHFDDVPPSSPKVIHSAASTTPDLGPYSVSVAEAHIPPPGASVPPPASQLEPRPPSTAKPEPKEKSQSVLGSRNKNGHGSSLKKITPNPQTQLKRKQTVNSDGEEESETETESEPESDSDASTTTTSSSEYSPSPPLHPVSGDKSMSPAIAKGPSRKSISRGSRRGVSFKVGLLADRAIERYYGPLMSMDQIREAGENLTELIFSKFILSTHADVVGIKNAERGYLETQEKKLSEALYTCLSSFNKFTRQNLELVFFQDAVRHMARLSRVMATSGGHALLLGTDYCTGRATLVRLATFLASFRLFEVESQATEEESRKALHDVMKKCSKTAAISGRQVVLLVRGNLGDGSLGDICSFMKEGYCDDLYSNEEVQMVASQMTPGNIKITRIDKVEFAFNKFLTRVKQNLHVIICADLQEGNTPKDGPSLDHQLSLHPTLLHRCCHIDVYRPWTQEAYVQVACKWLTTPSKLHVSWNKEQKLDQISLVAKAMGYIHTSCKLAIEQLHCHQRQHFKFFTPLTYKEYIYIFKVIASYIRKKEEANKVRYEGGLHRINEALTTVDLYKGEVADLIPQHQKAQEAVKEHVDYVESQREEYIKALDRCKVQEEVIEQMQGPLQKMRQEAQAEFDKVSPVYQAAVETMQSLSAGDVAEIKSFITPPLKVASVMFAVCTLFKVEPSWENVKLLMTRVDFFKEMIFYDKDHISDDIFLKLADFVHDPEMSPELVACVSKAAAGVCVWIRAVYHYAEILREMNPKLKQLDESEAKVVQEQLILGKKRVEANQIKSALEARIHTHRAAVLEAKSIDKKIQSIEKQINTATRMIDSMEVQNKLWKMGLKQARSRLKTAPGDALLTAAAMCYHGPFDNGTRAELMRDWLARCEAVNFDLDFSVGTTRRMSFTMSAKVANLLKSTYSISESLPSGHVADNVHAVSMREDISDAQASERAESPASNQAHVYRHRPSICDLGATFKTELRIHQSPVSESDQGAVTDVPDLLATREGFTLQSVLSSPEEVSKWQEAGLPSDIYSLHNAFMMRIGSHVAPHTWPLLIDPDNHSEKWVRMMHVSENVIRLEELHESEEDFSLQDGLVAENASIYYEDASPPSRATLHSEFTDDVQSNKDLDESRSTMTRSGVEEPHLPTLTHQITQNEADLNLKVTLIEDIPADRMWIISADDPDLEDKIITAVIQGVTALVQNVEQTKLQSPVLKPILEKCYMLNEDGKRIVMIGETEIEWHPNFKLYLCSSSPIFMQGGSIVELPIQTSCVIDLATSQEGIVETLQVELMKQERPEFLAQKHSIESDLIHHRKKIKKEQDHILDFTLNLKEPILACRSMTSILINCKKTLETTTAILEETQYLCEHLEEKRTPYIPVAQQAAKLYEIVQRMCVLSPLYYMPLDVFLKLFIDNLHSRDRGKAQGLPTARAQELINSTNEEIYKYVATMMFEGHAQLFALLVTMERLRTSNQLTNQELALFVNGVDTSLIEDTVEFEDRPSWLTNKIWLDCSALEATLPCFQGLRQSLIRYNSQWHEYFMCTVFLHSPVPDDALEPLTIFQKCLLWKICAPSKIFDVTQALVLFELGGVIQPTKIYNLKAAYKYSERSRPVVIILPSDPENDGGVADTTTGHMVGNPVEEIIQLARDSGKEGKVHVVTLGVSSQAGEIESVIYDCMQQGYWLVIHNSHLAETWSKDLHDAIQVIIDSRNTVDIVKDDSSTLKSDSNESLAQSPEAEEFKVHRDFRLWLTTRTDIGRLIPAKIIQNGVKVTCKHTHNFYGLAQRSFHAVKNLMNKKKVPRHILKKVFGEVDPAVTLSLLHSVLLHRRTYQLAAFTKSYYWTAGQLHLMVDLVMMIATLTQKNRGVADIAAEIYGRNCAENFDWKTVEAIAKTVLMSADQLEKLPRKVHGLAKLVQILLPSKTESLLEKLDTLVDLRASNFGLPESAEIDHIQFMSRNLTKNLLQVLGSPDLITLPTELCYKKAERLLMDLQDTLLSLPALPDTKADAFYPMEQFFHAEKNALSQQLSLIQSDVSLLLKVISGEMAATPLYRGMLLAISRQEIPKCWLEQSFPCDVMFSQYGECLQKRITLLDEYVKSHEKVACFNLAVFNRPDRFLNCVLQTFARKQFKDLQRCKMEIQILSKDAMPEGPPAFGQHIIGLNLHNAAWDNSRGSIAMNPSNESEPYKMPVIWLKPYDSTSPIGRPKSGQKLATYECPVYMASRSVCMEAKYAIGNFALPTIQSPEIWSERRVHLSCAKLL